MVLIDTVFVCNLSLQVSSLANNPDLSRCLFLSSDLVLHLPAAEVRFIANVWQFMQYDELAEEAQVGKQMYMLLNIAAHHCDQGKNTYTGTRKDCKYLSIASRLLIS